MPKLNFIIICDNAFFGEEDKKLNIEGVFDTIYSRDFPTIHKKMSVVSSFDDMESGNHAETIIIERNSSEIARFDHQFSKSEPGKHKIINNLLNVGFQDEGEYNVKILLDGQLMGSEKLTIQTIR